MAEYETSIIKRSGALTRFDPKARKELVVRGLNALSEVRDADFYFFKGEEHRIRGELKMAISYYEKALQINGEHEDSLFLMGSCYVPCIKGRKDDDIDLDHLTRNEKAAAAFQKLIEIREKKDSIWWWGDYAMYYNLGLTQYHLDLYKEAIKNLERAIELNPDDADSYYMLGLSQEKLEIYHLALGNFETCLSLNSLETSSLPECIKYAKTRIEQLKGLLTDTYFFNIGYRFWKKNEYKQAIECYSRAIELNPDFADAYYNLALAQEKMAETTYSQLVLFNESDWKKSIYELHRLALDNFEKYLRLVDNEVAEKEQFITYANQRVNELREMLEKVDTE